MEGLYVSGWMRRGPSGVIGTNKKDATEVGEVMLQDQRAHQTTSRQELESWHKTLMDGGAISKQDWELLDAWETSEGEQLGKPRRKLVTLLEVQEALNKLKAASATA